MFVGLDIGTSSVKAGIFSGEGVLNTQKIVKYDLISAKPGYKEIDAEELYCAVLTCLSAISEKNKYIETITVSGLGEGIVFLDEKEKPLTNIIVGTDIRGSKEQRTILNQLGAECLIDITRVNPGNIYSINKILWVREHFPKLFDKTKRICTVQDFIVGRLCGEYKIDYSMASRTMLFDSTYGCWSDEILNAVELDKSLLSEPVPMGTIAGELKKELLLKLGGKRASYIVLGVHDHIGNAFGAGVTQPGYCSNTCGTTEGITTILQGDEQKLSAIPHSQISFEPYEENKKLYATVAWNNTSGAMYQWLINNFAEKNNNLFAKLEMEVDVGRPSRLMVLPHFSGAATPYMDEFSRGAILGLALDTKPSEIYQAMIEGTNFEMLLICDTLEKEGISIEKIVSTGAAVSDKILTIKSNILGKTIHTVCCKQTGTLGGALIGMVTRGVYSDITEAARRVVKPGKIYEPDMEQHELYLERFQVYRELYDILKGVNHYLSFGGKLQK